MGVPVVDQERGLTELQLQVIDLRVNETLTTPEIAKRLGKSVSQVAKILRLPKVADESVEGTRAVLMGSAPLAAQTLIELLGHRSGYVRSQAASAILDRAGVVAPREPLVRVKNVTINIGLGRSV